jgi:hypothetical protein
MKKINCSSKCRKTSQLQKSNKCIKIAFIKEGSITYSCDTQIKSIEEINYYNCDFINNGIKSECNACSLPCITKNFKSKSIKKAEEKLKSMGFSVPKSEDESRLNTVVANYAKKVFEDGLSGKGIDMDRLKAIYSLVKRKNKQ